jgi:hypothetical protein
MPTENRTSSAQMIMELGFTLERSPGVSTASHGRSQPNTKNKAARDFSSTVMHCTMTDCCLNDLDMGTWTVRETPKSVIFELVEKPNTHEAHAYIYFERLVCRKDNNSPHALRDWSDGEYTVYPHRAGTPYHFTPILP